MFVKIKASTLVSASFLFMLFLSNLAFSIKVTRSGTPFSPYGPFFQDYMPWILEEEDDDDPHSFSLDMSEVIMRISEPKALPPYIRAEGIDHDIAPRLSTQLATVVLDLDETLVTGRGDVLQIREGARELLLFLSGIDSIEIIVWTAGHRYHAINALNAIRAGHDGIRIDHLITRGPWRLKNLALLQNRPNIVLVDDQPDQVTYCQRCAIQVPAFWGVPDGILGELRSFFEHVTLQAPVQTRFEDDFLSELLGSERIAERAVPELRILCPSRDAHSAS